MEIHLSQYFRIKTCHLASRGSGQINLAYKRTQKYIQMNMDAYDGKSKLEDDGCRPENMTHVTLRAMRLQCMALSLLLSGNI